MDKSELKALKIRSAKIRATALHLLKQKNGGHLGGSMSIVEILSVLYGKYMKYDPADPSDPDRDYLVLSKGHAGPALYSALSVAGYFPEEDLKTMNEGGTRFPSHPDRIRTPGVDATTGSLGQGISMAAGLAYALKLEKKDTQRVYSIVGDGELNEGQCWEAFQFIANYKLDNLIVFIDMNKRQLDGYTIDVMDPFDTAEKMKAFGFDTQTVDGGDEQAIAEAIDRAIATKGKALCIVLDTVKGQGVPYFEQMADNHSVKFKPADIAEVDKALEQLDSFIREG